VDFVSKFEEENRQRAETEIRKTEQAARQRADAAAQFGPIVIRLRPILEQNIEDVEIRLGIQLRLHIGNDGITLAAPARSTSFGSSALPYTVTISNCTNGLLRVRAEIDGRLPDRPYDLMPDNMTIGDYYGTVETVADVQESLEDLVSGDLELLLEWLVGCARGSALPTLLLRGTKRLEEERSRLESEKKRRASSAGWCVLLGILSTLFFPYAGPVALIWGISINSALKKAQQEEGMSRSRWAIFFGVCSSIEFLARIAMRFRS
jgi:hypothetical protein